MTRGPGGVCADGCGVRAIEAESTAAMGVDVDEPWTHDPTGGIQDAGIAHGQIAADCGDAATLAADIEQLRSGGHDGEAAADEQRPCHDSLLTGNAVGGDGGHDAADLVAAATTEEAG